MQLDLFEHSADTMLRNAVVDALAGRDAAAARAARQALAEACPGDDAMPALDALLRALDAHPAAHPLDGDTARACRDSLEREAEPAAHRIFGDAAWVRPCWAALAAAAAGLPYQPETADLHAAGLWLRAADWARAAEAVAGIASWRRIPVPLGWMAEARYRLLGLDAAWPLLAELAWLAPGRFGDLQRRLADPLLERLLRRFGAGFDGDDGGTADLAWFPAWALTEQSALARVLATAEPSRHTAPERALRLLVELIGLEHQGRHHDVVERRRRLRDLQPSLYAAYLRTR